MIVADIPMIPMMINRGYRDSKGLCFSEDIKSCEKQVPIIHNADNDPNMKPINASLLLGSFLSSMCILFDIIWIFPLT